MPRGKKRITVELTPRQWDLVYTALNDGGESMMDSFNGRLNGKTKAALEHAVAEIAQAAGYIV